MFITTMEELGVNYTAQISFSFRKARISEHKMNKRTAENKSSRVYLKVQDAK